MNCLALAYKFVALGVPIPHKQGDVAIEQVKGDPGGGMVLKVMVSCSTLTWVHMQMVLSHIEGVVYNSGSRYGASATVQTPQVDFIMHNCGCHGYPCALVKRNSIHLTQEMLDPGSEGMNILMQVAWEAMTMTGQTMPWTFSLNRSFHLTYLDMARDGPMGKGAHNSWIWSWMANKTWFVSLSLRNFRKKIICRH